MQIKVTIGSGVFEGVGVEFPTSTLTCVVVLGTTVPACDNLDKLVVSATSINSFKDRLQKNERQG